MLYLEANLPRWQRILLDVHNWRAILYRTLYAAAKDHVEPGWWIVSSLSEPSGSHCSAT